MNSRLVILMTCLIFVHTRCTESRETRVQRFLLQGNEQVQKRETVEAERYFRAALKIDSCFVDALNNLGTIYYERGDLKESLAFYARAVKCDPGFIRARYNRANVLLDLYRADEASADLIVLERLAPDSLPTRELAGLVAWSQYDYPGALSRFRQILDRDPRHEASLINAGYLYGLTGAADSARAYLRRAIGLDGPRVAEAWNALAMVEADAGNPERAFDALEQALGKSPRNPWFLNNKGYLLLLAERPDEAVQYINESIVADANNPWAYRNKGIYYAMKANFADALRLLKHAENIDPDLPRLAVWLARTYAGAGDRGQACVYFRKALQKKEADLKEVEQYCGKR